MVTVHCVWLGPIVTYMSFPSKGCCQCYVSSFPVAMYCCGGLNDSPCTTKKAPRRLAFFLIKTGILSSSCRFLSFPIIVTFYYRRVYKLWCISLFLSLGNKISSGPYGISNRNGVLCAYYYTARVARITHNIMLHAVIACSSHNAQLMITHNRLNRFLTFACAILPIQLALVLSKFYWSLKMIITFWEENKWTIDLLLLAV